LQTIRTWHVKRDQKQWLYIFHNQINLRLVKKIYNKEENKSNIFYRSLRITQYTLFFYWSYILFALPVNYRSISSCMRQQATCITSKTCLIPKLLNLAKYTKSFSFHLKYYNSRNYTKFLTSPYVSDDV
jgi:hypothetical protein